MKTEIREMHVEGFGKLSDRRYNLEGPMTLFYGPNEAGKSTLLAFLRAMLFGQPARGHAAERHEPLRGGAHGGSLTLTDGQGRAVRVERRFASGAESGRGRPGTSAGSVRLVGPEDGIASSGAAEVQLNALLGGLSADLFRSLFAFSLTELQELGALQADELSGYLYSAGWGTSGRAVIAVEKRLAQEAERLYRPRGKNQELALAIRAWEDEEAGLRQSREQLSGYNRLAAELAEVDVNIVEAEEEALQKRVSAAWTDKLLQAEEPFRRLERIRVRLGELPAIESFPVEAGQRYERAATEHEARLSQLDLLGARRSRLEQELIEELQVDDVLLADKLRLDELLEGAAAYRDKHAAVVQRLVERQQMEKELERLLEQLGPEWDVERIATVPVTIAVKERLRNWEDERTQLVRRREMLQAELDGAERLESAAHREMLQQQARLERKRQETNRRFSGWRELSAEELRFHMQQLRREQAEWMRLYSELQRLAAEQFVGAVLTGAVTRPRAVERGGASEARVTGAAAHGSLPAPASRRGSAVLAAPRGATDARASARSGRRRDSDGGLRAVAWLLAALSVAVPAAAWAAGEPVLAASCFAVLAVAAGYAAFRAYRSTAASGPAAQASEAAEQEQLRLERECVTLSDKIKSRLSTLRVEEAEGGYREVAATSGRKSTVQTVSPSIDFVLQLGEQWLEQLELDTDTWLAAKQELDHLECSSEDTGAALESLVRQRELVAVRCEDNERQQAILAANWDDWLQQHGLPSGLSPSGAADIWQAVERGLDVMKRLEITTNQYEELQASIREFQQQATELCKKHAYSGVSLWSESGLELIPALKELQASADDQRLRHIRLQQAERELTQLVEDIRITSEHKLREESQISELWQKASAETLDQFLRHVQENAERESLLKEQRELDYVMQTLVGKLRLEEAQDTLRSCTVSIIEEESAHYTTAIHHLQEKLNKLRDQRGRLMNEMDKLESGEEHAERMLRVQSSAADVERQARRWATLALASSLFRNARERYETERQPAVLLTASRYFEQMTEGSYIKVTAPIGDKRLLVHDKDGSILDSSALSRGTAEQLYLAMRFAFAAEFSTTTALPLIMDDVFVNFDPQRLKQIFLLLRDISGQHQVLFFTCHPHVRQAAYEAIPDLQVIDMV